MATTKTTSKETKMVTKIQYIITKGLTATDTDKRKEARYRRAVENAIANTEDAIVEYNAKAEDILKESGDYATAGHSAELGDALNNWLDIQSQIDSLNTSLTKLKELLTSLDTEVEVTEG